MPDETWRRTALVWVNYPNNPTGATAPLAFYERLAALAREHDFVLASDEAYTELWFDEPPVSALQLADWTNLAVFNTLSKRSSMTGYRSGFVAGDPELVAALQQFRPNVGTAPQEFVQRASVVAWGDEEHVERARAAYAAKRELFLDLFARVGPARRRRAGDDVPLGRDARPARRRRASRRGCSSTACSSRRGRSSAPPARATSASRSCRPQDECGRAVEILERVALTASVPGLVAGSARISGDGARGRRSRRCGSRARSTPRRSRRRSRCSTPARFASREPAGGGWHVNEWVKKAILLYFRIRKVEPMDVGGLHFLDKIPVKSDYADRGVRVVPPGVARYGSFLSEGCVLMPGYVNIGAWVGPRTMVDTWATVGSCAQVGADVHLAGGVGIGGVLEPPQAAPVIIEDGAFIGSRAVIVEGVRIGAGAVIAPNVVLSASIPIIDVTGAEPVEYRGEVPAREVVLPGVRQKEFAAGSYGLQCALIVGERSASTDLKTSLNDVLREFEIAV